MSGEWYEALNRAAQRTPRRKAWLRRVCRWLPMAVAGGYLATLLWLLCQSDPRWPRFAAVPAAVFLLVTLLRRVLDLPRPYEVHAVEPLLPARRKGCSLPSRHTASAVILALAGWYLHPALGAVFTLAALGVALTRLLAGVHFVRDLLAACGMALLIGIPGFWLI